MKKTKTDLNYFGPREEQAILDFINSDSSVERNQIYNEILAEPFRIMKETILKKYPIYIGNYDITEVEQNGLTHMIEHMVKFNPDRIGKSGNRVKAYSYCQTILRNYYKDHGKKSYNEKKINLPYDDYAEELNNNVVMSYEIDNNPMNHLDTLINTVIEKIENIIDNDPQIKPNEFIVGDAIINILRNWNVLFLEDTPEGKYNKRISNKFAKNKILLLLKEQTNLSTKEIRLATKPFKDMYFIEKINHFKE